VAVDRSSSAVMQPGCFIQKRRRPGTYRVGSWLLPRTGHHNPGESEISCPTWNRFHIPLSGCPSRMTGLCFSKYMVCRSLKTHMGHLYQN